MRVAGGAALGLGTAKAVASRGGSFGSLLDGCLAGDGGRGESSGVRPSQPPGEKSQDCGGASHATELPQMPGGKSQTCGLAAPAAVPVPATATLLPQLAWGLEPWESPGDSAAQAPETDAGSILDPARDPAAAIRRGACVAGPPAPEAPVPDDDPLAEPDLAGRPGAATPEAAGELAFGARLLPTEPVSPPASATDSLASQAAVTVSSADSPGAGTLDRSAPAGDESSQPSGTGLGGTARAGSTAASGSGAADAQDSAIHGDARGAAAPPGGQAAPTAERREAGPASGIQLKGGAPPGEHQTADGGENPPAGQPVIESVCSLPSSAAPESPSGAPAQPASGARPAEAETAEPAAQPATRDVSLHLADGDSSVDIRMAERAGEIRVTVHTPDRDLANSMRRVPGERVKSRFLKRVRSAKLFVTFFDEQFFCLSFCRRKADFRSICLVSRFNIGVLF